MQNIRYSLGLMFLKEVHQIVVVKGQSTHPSVTLNIIIMHLPYKSQSTGLLPDVTNHRVLASKRGRLKEAHES